MAENESIADWDVLVIGAGAAGVGVGKVLKDLRVPRFAVLDRHEVGASFSRWPREMRFISPSFTGNSFGLLDLNAVCLDTSPAYTLTAEHPTGRQYAKYLRAIVEAFEIPIESGVDVLRVEPPSGERTVFRVHTSRGVWTTRFLVWCAGEFQYPRLDPFAGSELCQHNSGIGSWRDVAGDELLVLGGSESGIDAACRLVGLGKRVRVLDRAAPWNSESGDPSQALTPITVRRLQRALETGRLELVENAGVHAVVRAGDRFVVECEGDRRFETPAPPILCAGFSGSLQVVRDLFDWHEDGYALLTAEDESTRTLGLFVCGPMVRHENIIFCFIYKFRQRFAVVGNAIAGRLGLDLSPLETYRNKQMFLDDLSCCGDTCAC